LQAFKPYLHERLAAFPQLTGRRLHRELRDLGYTGGYTILTELLREIRSVEVSAYKVRFGTVSINIAPTDLHAAGEMGIPT
jgi:transposase